jgi:hypothetical protein
VFAKATSDTRELGYPYIVRAGAHYLADDPIVAARPDLFTTDCRYGLTYSNPAEPPACLSVPPDEDEQPAPRRGRPRAQAVA